MSKEIKTVKNTNEEVRIEVMIDELVKKANVSMEEMLKLDQEEIDKIVQSMAKAGLDNHIELAQMAVDETSMGVFEDKITKNILQQNIFITV